MEGKPKFVYVKKDDRNQQQQQKKQEKAKEAPKEKKSKSPANVLSEIWVKGNESPFIDSHVHLDLINDFEKEKKNEIKEENWDDFRKSNFGSSFQGCINVCCFTKSYDICERLQDKYDWVFGTFGIHPHSAKEYNDEWEQRIIKNVSHPKCVAVGECGLDFFKNISPQDVQIQAFIRQMKIAVSQKKPIVIHTRSAEDETWKLLTENLPIEHKIHIHCFTGTLEFLSKVLKHFPNSFVGFTGAITFGNKDADSLRNVVKNVPLNRILLETDGPFMAPIPLRGETAHPGMIPLVGEQIAQLHGVSLSTVLAQTSANAHQMYGCFPNVIKK